MHNCAPCPYTPPVDDVEEETYSRLDAMNPESLRSAKLSLYGALAAETPRQYCTVLLSSMAPYFMVMLGEAMRDLAGEIGSDDILAGILEVAEKNGMKGPPIDALKDLLAAKKAQVPGPFPSGYSCIRPPTQVDPDGTLVLPLEESHRSLADRDEIRVHLPGVHFPAVKVTRSDAGYFVEAPVTPLLPDGFAPKRVFRGMVRNVCLYAMLPRLGALESEFQTVTIAWDPSKEELVFAYVRKNVERVNIEVPTAPAWTTATFDRATTIAAIVEIAKSGVSFDVPGASLVVGSGDPAELAAYLATVPDEILSMVLENAQAVALARSVTQQSAAGVPVPSEPISPA